MPITNSDLVNSILVVMKMVLCYSRSCFVPIMLKLTSKLTLILIDTLFHIYRSIGTISSSLTFYRIVCVGFVCGFLEVQRLNHKTSFLEMSN